MEADYRPDIDGLRAIAVLSVLGFHAGFTGFRGGFAGVDVFFVISGYLISGIISRALDRESFSFREFYVRRINRLLPALILILAVTLALGWTFLLASEMSLLGHQVRDGAAFVLNFTLRRETRYFDLPFSPLLHLWSLGVEEQFYLVFPAICIVALERRWSLRWILIALVAISFGANVWAVQYGHARSAFFLPFTRFWEILAGALLFNLEYRRAFHAFSSVRLASRLRQAAPWVGISLLAVTAVEVNRDTPWPGLAAVIPVIGTLLLIYGGAAAPINRIVLSNKVLVGLGLISYPFYLWDWPLLSFAKLIEGDTMSLQLRVGILAVSVALAFATYQLLEVPIRFGDRKRRNAVLLLALLAIAAVGGAAFGSGVPGPRIDGKVSARVAKVTSDWTYPGGGFRGSSDQMNISEIPGDSSRKVVFIGDSHSEQYWPRVEALARKSPETMPLVLFLTYAGCPMFPDAHRAATDADRLRLRCDEFYRLAMEKANAPDVSAVVFSAWWLGQSGANTDVDGSRRPSVAGASVDSAYSMLADDIERLRTTGTKVYIVLPNPVSAEYDPIPLMVSRVPFGRSDPKLFVSRATVELEQRATRQALMNLASETGATIIDPLESLCDESMCATVGDDGLPIYKDDNHMRAGFARVHASFIDPVFER